MGELSTVPDRQAHHSCHCLCWAHRADWQRLLVGVLGEEAVVAGTVMMNLADQTRLQAPKGGMLYAKPAHLPHFSTYSG